MASLLSSTFWLITSLKLKYYDLYRLYRHACIFGMVGKPWFAAFQNFFRIENQLNIKQVMGRNMCACICILYWLYQHNIAFEPLKHDVLWSLVSTVSTWDTTQHTMHCSHCFDLCVSTVLTCTPYPLRYTCVIRWQWVWISDFLVI